MIYCRYDYFAGFQVISLYIHLNTNCALKRNPIALPPDAAIACLFAVHSQSLCYMMFIMHGPIVFKRYITILPGQFRHN